MALPQRKWTEITKLIGPVFVKMWPLQNHVCEMVFKYHLKSTESIRISEDGFMIAIFLEDGLQKVNLADSNYNKF